MSARGVGAAALAAAVIMLMPVTNAAARVAARKTPAVRAAAHASRGPEQAVPRAPGGSPLSGEGASLRGEQSSAPPSGGDALVENGLGSPICRETSSQLPAEVKRNCELAGFVGAPDPIGDYALDVNINTPIGDIGKYFATTIQNFTGFGWMVFVSVMQGLIVMLEWCYSLDKLTNELLTQIASALRGARMTLTEPWMAATLSIAAILFAYHGLVRRRVAETLGQALTMFVMMAVGLWLIADPARTIGVLDNWANQAGLGTLAAVASGSPESPERTFASDMRRLFGATIDSPWCYMEFGNVGWCRGALDPNLHRAALAIADKEQSESGCRELCGSEKGPKSKLLAASAALLRNAKSNEELFLALPANELARNSTKREWSLLSVLCGGGEKSADECTGPTAAQAEFRSEKGTQQRLIGLILVWAGGLGMLALLGFLTLHLLTAVIRTIVFLLLAPAAVLAPAFGEQGRSLFRTWITRLLAAAVSKLIYSFALGVVLLMVYLLLSLTMLGWWGQWLVLSAFWWGVFVKRHEISALVEGPAKPHQRVRRPSLSHLRRPLNKARDKLKEKTRTPPPDPPKRPPTKKGPDKTTRKPEEDQAKSEGKADSGTAPVASTYESQQRTVDGDPQVTRTLDCDRDCAIDCARVASEEHSLILEGQAQLERLHSARTQALADGDSRRAATLDVRVQRVERDVATRKQALSDALKRVSDGDASTRVTGSPHTPEERDRRSRFLNAQASLLPAGRKSTEGVSRDYAALAGLAGYGAQEYIELAPLAQREARLQIDRELADRAQQMHDASRLQEPKHLSNAPPSKSAASPNGAPQQSANKKGPGSNPSSSPRTRSPVMEDAFAVQRRRKRQLGREMLD